MEPKVHVYYLLIHKAIMCTTRGQRKLISIRCQKECVESKLKYTPVGRANFDILKILLLLIISICIFLNLT